MFLLQRRRVTTWASSARPAAAKASPARAVPTKASQPSRAAQNWFEFWSRREGPYSTGGAADHALRAVHATAAAKRKMGRLFVEAGAQGFHKVQRGYMPATTYSAHWVAHDGFRAAIERFLAAERGGIDAEVNNIEIRASPFKKG